MFGSSDKIWTTSLTNYCFETVKRQMRQRHDSLIGSVDLSVHWFSQLKQVFIAANRKELKLIIIFSNHSLFISEHCWCIICFTIFPAKDRWKTESNITGNVEQTNQIPSDELYCPLFSRKLLKATKQNTANIIKFLAFYVRKSIFYLQFSTQREPPIKLFPFLDLFLEISKWTDKRWVR